MDSYEATRMVFSRIQSLDPENASKIMGYLLLQDHGDKEMIRLAFGPEAIIHSLILQAKTQLGLSSNSPSTPSTPSSPSPFNRPSPLSISSSRMLNNNGFDLTNSPSPSSTSWSLLSPNSTSSLSYAGLGNGTSNNSTGSASLSPIVSLSNALPYYSRNNIANNTNVNGLVDEYQLQDQFPFLSDSKNDDLCEPRLELAMSPTAYGDILPHKRSFSVPGICFGSEDASAGFGWKPCLYFARGFCKNGTSCRFLHGESADGASIVGSPIKLNDFEQCQELLRSQQQKLAAASHLSAGASFPYNKCMDFLLQQPNGTQRSAAPSALIMGDELPRFGRCRPGRNDFSPIGIGGAINPGSRQIYLTFPADSTFREEDVSNYFSIYGPVQDVRIPYQQKRMFGFVTFVYPETVKLILAKGNPHFVCDSRVLVKPYKEKGKVPEKKLHLQQQQIERGEYSACSIPSGLDFRETFDLHLGAGVFSNNQEIRLRKNLEEQADLQQSIELQERRLMNLQLLDIKSHNHFHQQKHLHGLSSGSPLPSPTLPHTTGNQIIVLPPGGIDQEVPEEKGGKPEAAVCINAVAGAADQEVNPASTHNNGDSNNNNEDKSNTEESDLHESLEHILPDNLFF